MPMPGVSLARQLRYWISLSRSSCDYDERSEASGVVKTIQKALAIAVFAKFFVVDTSLFGQHVFLQRNNKVFSRFLKQL